jgi:hypothetical protein
MSPSWAGLFRRTSARSQTVNFQPEWRERRLILISRPIRAAFAPLVLAVAMLSPLWWGQMHQRDPIGKRIVWLEP